MRYINQKILRKYKSTMYITAIINIVNLHTFENVFLKIINLVIKLIIN